VKVWGRSPVRAELQPTGPGRRTVAAAGSGMALGGGPRPVFSRRVVESRLRRLKYENALWILAILVGIGIAFSATAPGKFDTVFNIRNIGVSSAILLVMAVGQTLVIVTAGIDLSNGSVLVFSSVLSAQAMASLGGTSGSIGASLVGLVLALGAGVVWGGLNGFLVSKGHIPPLIVTLGTMGAALGFAEIITGGVDETGVPNGLNNTVGLGQVLGVPWLVLIAAVIAVLGALLLNTTRFGRHTLAIGSNVEAARRFGVHIDRHLLKVYALAGFLYGVAGYLSLALYDSTTINGHATDNLDAIAAVVIGGTSLFGGRGTVIGTTIGVLIPTTLLNGFTVLGVSPFWRDVSVGAVLVLAVYLDMTRRRRLRLA
jgi:ribose transport system permease protein